MLTVLFKCFNYRCSDVAFVDERVLDMNNCPELVHEGWLIKSPPTKRIFRARWRRRWFVLRHSGELPGQYFLCYYTDRSCRKLKGQIDLDECEQVDTGLQFANSKNKYQHMFDVRTPKRTYYLAADTEDEMMKWVHNVCHVCGLKAYTPEEDAYNYSGTAEEEPSTPTTVITEHDLESPPVSPSSTTSAYIPISECITGPPLTFPTAVYRASSQFHKTLPPHMFPVKRSDPTNNNVSSNLSGPSTAAVIPDEFYDSPRQLRPPGPHALEDLISSELRPVDDYGSGAQGDWDAQKSPGTDAESVFTDDDNWTNPGGNLGTSRAVAGQRPVVNWETFPTSESEQTPNARPSDSSVEFSLDTSADTGTWNAKRFTRYLAGEPKSVLLSSCAPPPPRPPKPSRLLLDPPGHNYHNIENVSPASHITEAVEKHKGESVSGSEPPSPLIETSTPLDGPSAIPGSAVVTDEMYDFPRSHQYAEAPDSSRPPAKSRHCYSNAAPGQVSGDGTVFRYDFQQDGQIINSVVNSSGHQDDEPTSPRSESSSVTSATQYSNLPSPHILPSGGIPTPPAVDRGLKPRRKTSDSAASNEPSPSPLSQHSVGPPSVDRKLKPRILPDDSGCLTLCAPPGKRQDGSRSLRKTRTGPSPTPPHPSGSAPSTLRNGFRSRADHCSSSDDDHRHSPDDDPMYKPYGSDHRFLSMGKEVKYIDLDLEQDKETSMPCTSHASVLAGVSIHPPPKSPEKGPPTATVYKTVDFIKTEAFNRTRQEVEAEKKKKENG